MSHELPQHSLKNSDLHRLNDIEALRSNIIPIKISHPSLPKFSQSASSSPPNDSHLRPNSLKPPDLRSQMTSKLPYPTQSPSKCPPISAKIHSNGQAFTAKRHRNSPIQHNPHQNILPISVKILSNRQNFNCKRHRCSPIQHNPHLNISLSPPQFSQTARPSPPNDIQVPRSNNPRQNIPPISASIFSNCQNFPQMTSKNPIQHNLRQNVPPVSAKIVSSRSLHNPYDIEANLAKRLPSKTPTLLGI